MKGLRRDFENDLLLELRDFARCKFKRKDPNHFCSNREFQKNLKMSARDVGKTLENLVMQGKIKHDRNVLYNGKLRDKFTVIDPRMYSPEEIIVQFRKNVTRQLLEIQALTEKMKKTPALYDVIEKRVPIPVYLTKDYPDGIPKNAKFVKPGAMSRSGKMNKKGFQYLVDFCNLVNHAFSYVDSLSYSQFATSSITNLDDLSEKVLVAGAIPKDDKFDKMISDLRRLVFDQTLFTINFVLQDLPALQQRAIGEALMLRIPTIYHLKQIETFANLKG
jgi:hypothetical protein